MNKKVIFVNATSATTGGSLTILKQFVENIIELKDLNKIYYIFVPINCKIESNCYLNIVPIKAKSYKDRIIWDLYGMKKWSKEKVLYPNLILSLQNTGVKFDNVKQIIYLHQPLPYSKESSWKFFRKDERKMWFYKHLYKVWIDISISKESNIIVQTEWMRNALIQEGYEDSNIIISKPSIKKIDINSISNINKDTSKIYFFYPAANYKYKNHKVIIDALKEIKKENSRLLEKIRIIFTINVKSDLYEEVIRSGLEDSIKFLGNLKYDYVMQYYKSCNVVLFPSYIETFGLPLVEGKIFGKKIIVSDCSYSREVLSSYENSVFIKHNDVNMWKKEIINSINPYTEKPEIDLNENDWSNVFKLMN